ncbi:hypothetical protein CARUB_v10005508mg [Capsella rubella]|uniref:Uncharacterized protein n=1 Tax=Capsella rubella TaxID=81985 RepID=R0F6R2_9BRAS|nr:uncharacterized protein LOC17880167 [Capsella rubella]EOA17236.1 hypothetical protein CARUB_v10005508mg [Capsella rubella]
MDSFSAQKTKSRKMKKVAKKSRVQIILDMFFRAMEIIVVLVTVAKLCYELVITFEDSGVAEVILANRSLAFVVGNAIVFALIAKSGFFLNQELDPKCKRSDLYEEFVRESSRRDGGISRAVVRGQQSEAENEAKQSITENIVKENEEKQSKYEKKTRQIISEKRVRQSKPEKLTKHIISVNREKQSEVEHQDIAVKTEKENLTEKRQIQSYKRSQSENLKVLEKSSCGKLKRSETDASSERFDSDDELRYKIESFIARQRRNQNDD